MITIHKSQNADSRTATGIVTKESLETNTLSHIDDVYKGMLFFAKKIEEAGENHDYTKILYLDEFYNDFISGNTGEDFKKMNWYKNRHLKERHHLNDRVPSDVNLVDVIEMITDCCMAGMARNGEITEVSIKDEVLQQAFKNTIAMLSREIKVIDNEEGNDNESH